MNPEQRRLLEMARRAHEAAARSISANDAATAANRAYYAMLYAAQAALVGEQVEVRSHGAVHAAFGIRFAKTARLDPRLHRWLLDAFDLRLLADYDPMWTLEAESIRETVEQAGHMIDAIERFLEPQNGS
ncbi:MAG: HEPN domain-containing protein [Candidatus Limnocylindrales bacterium]|nr:HEPN domain-containing protein [Candidatus Limnocylindrales bacterium]